jgi:hypothetical protein
MILCNEQQLNERPALNSPLKRNLTPGEREALVRLVRNPGIVIFPADKGSATVVMEGYNQLSDLKVLFTTQNTQGYQSTTRQTCGVSERLPN